jgi:hypothetical protein
MAMLRSTIIAAIVLGGWAATANGQTWLQGEPFAALTQYATGGDGCCDPSPATVKHLVAVRQPAPAAVDPPPWPTTTMLNGATLTPAPPGASCCSPCAPTADSCYLPSVGGVEGCSPCVAFRPILPLAAMPGAYYVGRGILGQPKLYVPGQPIRNALRWLTP